MLRHAVRESLALDWDQSRERSSLPCTVAIAICLITGVAIGQPIGGMIAASGAMSVGFGSFQRLGRSRVAPMLWASVGMAVFTAAGSLAGHSAAGVAINAALVGLFYGLMTAVSGGSAWISLQCAIFALVATGYPATIETVSSRALLILVGGLLQLLLVISFRRLYLGFVPTVSADSFSGISPALRALRANLSIHSAEFRYAVSLAVTLATAAVIAHALELSNGYWVPMTALLVLRTDLHATLSRGLARVAGTLVGAGLATVLVSLLRPGPGILIALVIVFAWLCYTLGNVGYGVLSAAVTAYIAFLLALAGLPEPEVALHRIENTCLGGVLAMLAALLAYRLAPGDT
jgi:uncharacterized membrane protein YccC